MNEANRKYEGMFILDVSTRGEAAVKEGIEKIQALLKSVGAVVHNLQKLETRPFARPRPKLQSGYYVSVVFSAPPKAIGELDAKLHLESGIWRWQFVHYEESPKAPARREKTEPAEAGSGGRGAKG
ncbi:MAG: 30S ribosomal protein S6 [Verrucomicrobiae bacterium]|nr:30S ribosomal protein S6 [Verrucomicrobiae bacterium]MDW8344251.1 30S ribosomal protein S6 [Verrucomicrobiae bacterium]